MYSKEKSRVDREQVECGVCKKVLNKDNIKNHFTSFHKGHSDPIYTILGLTPEKAKTKSILSYLPAVVVQDQKPHTDSGRNNPHNNPPKPTPFMKPQVKSPPIVPKKPSQKLSLVIPMISTKELEASTNLESEKSDPQAHAPTTFSRIRPKVPPKPSLKHTAEGPLPVAKRRQPMDGFAFPGATTGTAPMATLPARVISLKESVSTSRAILPEISSNDATNSHSERYSNADMAGHEETQRSETILNSMLSIFAGPAEVQNIFKLIRDFKTPNEIRNALKPFKFKIKHAEKLLKSARPVLFDSKMKINPFTNSRLKRNIREEFNVVNVKGDGSCMYASISVALFGIVENADIIRLIQVQHLLDNEDNLNKIAKPVLQEVSYESLLERTKCLPLNSSEGWGNESNLFVTSEIIGRPVIVNQINELDNERPLNRIYNSNQSCAQLQPIYISLRHQHFEPLMPKMESITSIESCSISHTNVTHKYVYMEDTNVNIMTDQEYSLLMQVQGPAYEVIQVSHQLKKEEQTRIEEKQEKFQLDSSHCVHSKAPINQECNTESYSMSISSEEECLSEAGSVSSGPDDITKLNRNMKELKNMMSLLLVNDRTDNSMIVDISGTKINHLCSIEQILAYFPFLKARLNERAEIIGDDVFNEIICEHCVDNFGLTRVGVFSYHSAGGVDFTNVVQPKEFRNLKVSMQRHIKTPKHQAATEEVSSFDKEEKIREDKNKIAARNCGTFAYASIKLDHNVSKYEDYICMAAALGLQVGEQNHSRKFCREFNNSVYECLRDDLKLYLISPLLSTGRTPPFSLIADKYTPDRRCGQIVGLIMFKDGKLKDINIDYARVKRYDGNGIANSLYKSLLDIVADDVLRTRFLGGCLDGEYFHKSVPQSFMGSKNLNCSDELKRFMMWDWDKPHVLERAMSDATKSSDVFATIDGTVHIINKHFTSGKGYLQAEEEASKSDDQLLAPLQSSETKFTSHQLRVLSNFSRNYATFYKLLNECRHTDLHLMDTIQFALVISVKIDMFHTITTLSSNCQKVGLYSWRLYDEFINAFNELEEMVNSIGNDPNMFHAKFVKLREAYSELDSLNPTYKKMPVYFGRQFVKSTRSSKAVNISPAQDVSTVLQGLKPNFQVFVRHLKDRFYDRANRNISEVYPLLEKSFKLENILEVAKEGTVPEEFINYFNLAKNAGYLYDCDTTSDDIRVQYLKFSDTVTGLYNDFMKLLSNKEQPLYKDLEPKIFSEIVQAQASAFPEVTDLLLSAICRTHCEAVCEGMGSVVKNVVDERSLDFGNIQKEMFVAYNGPMPYAAGATQLIQDAMQAYEKSHDRNFYKKTTRGSLLKYFNKSKVVESKIKEANESARLPYKTSKRRTTL